MIIIYIIIGCAISSLLIKIIKALDRPNNSNNIQNNNTNQSNASFTIKDGMNLYFGKVVGKLILTIGLIALLLLPIILSFLLT